MASQAQCSMIWDGASTKSHSVSAAAEARELGAGQAHVQDVAELVEERRDLAVLAAAPGVSPDGGVKFATIALTGATYSPSAARCPTTSGKAAACPNLPSRGKRSA